MNTAVPTGAPPKTTNWVYPSSELTPTSNGYACVGESQPSDDSVTVAPGTPSSLMVAESPQASTTARWLPKSTPGSSVSSRINVYPAGAKPSPSPVQSSLPEGADCCQTKGASASWRTSQTTKVPEPSSIE